MSYRAKRLFDLRTFAGVGNSSWQEESACRDERAAPLLEIIRELDRHSGRLADCQVGVVLHEAILACGFEDELEAWDAVLCHLDPTLGDPPAYRRV
jgi:hypothetical protein